MSKVIYEIVEHDGGWAYKAEGAFSETFASRADAHAAAERAAAEQATPGETEVISFQDQRGKWHDEVARGDDRPAATVDD